MIARYSLPLLLVAVAAQAQITITSTDFQNMFQVGRTFASDSAQHGTTIDIGAAASSAQSFDFSNLVLGATPTSGALLNAAGTPFADSFPGATLCIMFTIPGFGVGYSYTSIDASAVLDYGSASAFGVYRYSPPQPSIKFPATYGSAWTYVSDSTAIPFGSGGKMVTRIESIIDAFGTLMLPGAGPQQCLRSRQTTVTYTILEIGPGLPPFVDSTSSTAYHFYLQNGANVLVEVDSNHRNGGSVPVGPSNTVNYTHPGTSSGVADLPGLPAGVSLQQNYPNPFHDRTMVDYTLADRAAVRIDVVDMIGHVVSTVCSGPQDAGRHGVAINGAMLPAGRYDCRITVNGEVTNHPITVVK